MLLESWSALESIVGFVVACTVGSPVVYAWADRWLDRTRNSIRDEVVSVEKTGE